MIKTRKGLIMAPALPNLTGQEDVYSVHTTEHAPETDLAQAQLVVMLERFPGALARAFALLCLFELVPLATRTELCDDDAIRLELQFTQLPPDRLDLLLRKFNQLTECLGVWASLPGGNALAYPETFSYKVAGITNR
ncbi:MAG TPA: hypothetical protein VFG52_11470 [Xanthomonadales bacterium]|nr:hypothetical protein [Xanthomonadales bacterium]